MKKLREKKKIATEDSQQKSNLPLIAIDTREKSPFMFRAGRGCGGTIKKKLDHGDYQIDGLPNLISVERKQSIDELCSNIGKHRKRFERELERMQSCKYKYVVIEDSWFSIQDPDFSRLHYNAILGSIISFTIKYNIQFIFANNRKWARRITKQLLLKAYAEYKRSLK